jgi:hypothetical protein
MITLKQFYDMSLDLAKKRSPRPMKEIEERLKDLKKEYDKLDEKKKQYFDMESLKNPYLDSRILNGEPGTKIKRVMVGIDISIADLLLAIELGRNGKKIDAVFAHHPEGRALLSLTQVMDIQEDIAAMEGVPINAVEKMMRVRVGELNRNLHATNFDEVPDAARLLSIPFACFHTMADNNCHWFISSLVSKRKPRLVGDIVDILMEIPEFQEAKRRGNGPMISVGDEKSRAGKISYSGFTGGTSGPKDVIKKMAQAGVGTILAMHIPEDHRKIAEKYNMNIIITPHMASDSLGYNILLDEAEKRGVEVVACGGFIRVSRAKKRLGF